MKKVFLKIISFFNFAKRPVLGPLFVFLVLIAIVLFLSFGKEIAPFLYSDF
tara:strand:- start:174 stop:326 length:153 start_codon:yes stop_codon:yes gene_type:complete